MNAHRDSTSDLLPVIYEERAWDHREAYASRSARLRHSGPYRAAVPPRVSRLDSVQLVDGELLTELDEAARELKSFDEFLTARWGSTPTEIAPMSAVLLRTESASSSQIENLTVGARQLALFELGEASSTNAGLVGSNVRSMEAALDLGGPVTVAGILAIHRELLRDSDPDAGRIREQQVWIGGSSVGPHSADFVPPHSDHLPALLDDLVAFCDRTDILPLLQVALAHAQFETIHPFTDGNGRTGRALVQSMLKNTGLTTRSTVPVSAGLLRDTGRYFAALDGFREGDARPIIQEFSRASLFAASTGRRLVQDLDAIRLGAAERITVRRDAAAWRLNDLLVGQPVVNTAYVSSALGISKVAAQNAIDHLTAAGTLAESTKRVRHRVWQANEILARLDEFAASIRRPGA